jgi:hypothetical protein
MATVTLKKAAQKISEVFNSNSEDGGKPILYFEDDRILREWEQTFNPILEAGTRFIRAWNDVAKYPIQDISRLEYAWNNPAALYREEYKIENEEKLQNFIGLDIDITTLIRLPSDFDRVVSAAKELKKRIGDKKRNYFMLDGDQLILSNAAYERRNRSAYYFASTAEEKMNLSIAEEIRVAMERLATVVPHANKDTGKEAIATKRYCHPLPHPLKLVYTLSGWRLIPNPAFVKNGFKGTSILGFYPKTDEEKKLAIQDEVMRLGERMKKIQVIGESGLPTGDVIVCPPEDVDKYFWGPGRMRKNVVLDGFYNSEGKPYGIPLKASVTTLGEKIMNHIVSHD